MSPMARGPAKGSAKKYSAQGTANPTTFGTRKKPPAASRFLSEAVTDALELDFCNDIEFVAARRHNRKSTSHHRLPKIVLPQIRANEVMRRLRLSDLP
jgi:hypothetical protein